VGDTLARFLSDDGTIGAVAAVTTGLVEEARGRHATYPTATAALGRALTAALLLATTIKRDERLSLEFSGDGPLRGLLVEATPEGTARGFAYRPQTHVPPRNGKLDVGGALGAGTLCVMRVPLAGGALYRSIVPLVSGEIGVDVANYLVTSEQRPSAVGVGVLVDVDGRVEAAGGYLVQGMPGSDPERLELIARRIETAPPPTELVRTGHDPQAMLARLLDTTAGRVLDAQPVRLRCRCDDARVRRAILAMGRAEIEALRAEGHPAEVVCEFCGARYVVGIEELGALLDA